MIINVVFINGVKITRKKHNSGLFECDIRTNDGVIYFNTVGKYTSAYKYGEISGLMFDVFVREYSIAMGREFVAGGSI